jgi:hypothetical protein
MDLLEENLEVLMEFEWNRASNLKLHSINLTVMS